MTTQPRLIPIFPQSEHTPYMGIPAFLGQAHNDSMQRQLPGYPSHKLSMLDPLFFWDPKLSTWGAFLSGNDLIAEERRVPPKIHFRSVVKRAPKGCAEIAWARRLA